MPWRRVLIVAATLALLAIVAVAIGVFAWLKSYAPLSVDAGGWWSSAQQQSGVGAIVEPAMGSGGKRVVFPRFRRGRDFFVALTIWNGGRFDVTLAGVDTSDFVPRSVGMYPRDLRVAPPQPPGGLSQSMLRDTKPTNHIVIHAHDQRFVWIGFRMTSCGPPERNLFQSLDRVPLRIHYLGQFTRTQNFELPFAVTLICHAPLPRSNSPILDRHGDPRRSRAARAAAERADARSPRPHPRLRRARPLL